jgi:hypothetical protein
MESYCSATAYDFNDYSGNEVTRNHTWVSLCHYCHHIIDDQSLIICYSIIHSFNSTVHQFQLLYSHPFSSNSSLLD